MLRSGVAKPPKFMRRASPQARAVRTGDGDHGQRVRRPREKRRLRKLDTNTTACPPLWLRRASLLLRLAHSARGPRAGAAPLRWTFARIALWLCRQTRRGASSAAVASDSPPHRLVWQVRPNRRLYAPPRFGVVADCVAKAEGRVRRRFAPAAERIDWRGDGLYHELGRATQCFPEACGARNAHSKATSGI